MTAPFATNGEDGHTRVTAVDFKAEDAAGKQICAKSDKRIVEVFVKRVTARVERHEIFYGMLDALFGQVVRGASEDGIAAFTFGKANSSRGETEDLTGPVLAK